MQKKILAVKRPVFINSFSRGGSALVWDLIDSHPEFIAPAGETHQVVLGGDYRSQRLRSLRHDVSSLHSPALCRLPSRWTLWSGLFNPTNFQSREMGNASASALDGALALSVKLQLQLGTLRAESRPGVHYATADIEQLRVVSKNINGIVYLSPSMWTLYPDAQFIGLVRNGLALCEGRLRRGTARDAEEFGFLYNRLMLEMLQQSKQLPNYRIFRFEDLLDNPDRFMENLFGFLGARSESLSAFKMKQKGHYDASGRYTGEPSDNAPRVWVGRQEFIRDLNPGVNSRQIEKLDSKSCDAFLSQARPAMQALGYL